MLFDNDNITLQSRSSPEFQAILHIFTTRKWVLGEVYSSSTKHFSSLVVSKAGNKKYINGWLSRWIDLRKAKNLPEAQVPSCQDDAGLSVVRFSINFFITSGLYRNLTISKLDIRWSCYTM